MAVKKIRFQAKGAAAMSELIIHEHINFIRGRNISCLSGKHSNLASIKIDGDVNEKHFEAENPLWPQS